MSPPTISALLPVRNGERTVGYALADLFLQTRPADEVVVVDDGSTDGTAAIAAHWQARFAQDGRTLRVIRMPGPAHGLVNALNTGLAACVGELVARMDADDHCAPERFAAQEAMFVDDPSLAVVDTQVEIFRDDGPVGEGMARYAEWMNGVLMPHDFDRELLIESPVCHPAAMYRKGAVLAVGGYRDGPFPEDYDLWLRMHAAGARFAKVPRVLVRWRDHERRLTRTDPRYGRAGLRAVRQAWLQATVLAEPRRVVVVGAGKEGKPWIKWLLASGHTVPCAIDVHPRRTERAGVPVRPVAALADVDAEIGLVCVGARGAREEIRAQIGLLRPDWLEGHDWWAVR